MVGEFDKAAGGNFIRTLDSMDPDKLFKVALASIDIADAAALSATLSSV
jgi:hypothetical protein